MTPSSPTPAASAPSPVERYRALLAAARCFGRTMEWKALIDEILRRAGEVMRAEGCSLFLPDAQTGELILYSTDPRIASLPEPMRIPPGAGIAGAVYRSKQSVNLNDAGNDPRHYSAIGRNLGITARAMMTIPLLDGASCLGVMQALNPRDRESFNAEDEEIFEGFGSLIVNALTRLAAQRREIEQAQAGQQLTLAREIQETFLPPTVSRYPCCQVLHRHRAAQMVSGDFGFVHSVTKNRLLMGLGDVCGKGIPAALTMARATAIIEAAADRLEADLGAWVSGLNRLLARELKAGRFISLAFLLADPETGTLHICTAGQFPPLHFNGRQWQTRAVANHLPLGILPATLYAAETVSLRPGDYWLLFTDGFPEARNRQGEEYTGERFLASLPGGQTAEPVLGAAFQAWDNFRDASGQQDDASVMLLDWRGPQPPAELSTACCPENLAMIRQFVERWAAFAGFGDLAVGQIVMGCDEACANVFRHGYGQKTGPLRFQVELTAEALVIHIIDEAPPIDVREIRCRALDDLRPGGLGTFVMAQVFDEVTYHPRETGNTLRLRKALPGSAGGGRG